MTFLTGTTYKCPRCGEWVYNNLTHLCDDNRLQPCGHILRYRVFAKEGGEYCLMCEYQTAEFAAKESQRILQSEIAKARQAALEEAKKIADGFSFNWAGEEISAAISRLANLHASQQPHVVDASPVVGSSDAGESSGSRH